MLAPLRFSHPPLFAPLTASVCIHLPFSQSAGNHIGMRVRYLVGARAAVGRWVSMRRRKIGCACTSFATVRQEFNGCSTAIKENNNSVLYIYIGGGAVDHEQSYLPGGVYTCG